MKNIIHFFFLGLIVMSFTSCVGDDIIEDRVTEDFRINNAIDTIGFGSTYQFESRYLNNVGVIQDVDVESGQVLMSR